ncbi:MAG TPA: hypothetical protein VFD60_02040 [Nitrososphaeraceae archaeon]|nr:hypothetical protein [Nitrososphaeraceae archaeon]
MLNKLVDNAAEDNRVKCVLADGMYDSNNRNFRYLSKSHIKPGIKTRSNSKVKTTTNCHARNMSVVRSVVAGQSMICLLINIPIRSKLIVK